MSVRGGILSESSSCRVMLMGKFCISVICSVGHSSYLSLLLV